MAKRKGILAQLFARKPKRKKREKKPVGVRSMKEFRLGSEGKVIGGYQYHYKATRRTKAGAMSAARDLTNETGAITKVIGKKGDWVILYRFPKR